MHRGSTWHIWDFHLHTPYSILNNRFGDPRDDATWDRYVSKIETRAAEIGIAAIGITDYFTIEGYKHLRKYQQAGRLQDLLIFPNVEFRVDKVIYRSKDVRDPKRLNFHVLFAPDLPLNYIEEHFLHDLDFTHENHPFEPAHVRKLKLSNLEEFGGTLRNQEAKFRSSSALKVGCVNAKVPIDQIKQRLEEDGRFRGKYLLVLANEDMSLMEWGKQDHATRQQLIQMSHAVFSSNASDRDFSLGKIYNSQDAFIDEFKSFKPCIWGCDSHGFEERFLEPDGKRYCWIKGEVSWEGLKQILYEPEDRVSIQPQSPEPQKSYFTLDSIGIERTQVNDALCIDDHDIKLNPNLVAIIGGRGSGKTALLDLIAASFPEGNKLKELDNSFYYRLYGTGRPNTSQAQPVPTTVHFRSGDEFPKLVGWDEKVFERADVLYLTQNHIDDYTANPAKLYDHIIDLVFDQNPERRNGYDELVEQAEELQRRIQSFNLKIEQLRHQVEGKLGEAQAERMQKRGELVDYRKRLEEQQAQQAGSGTETLKLTDRLKLLRSQRDQMIAVHERLSTIIKDVFRFREQYRHDVQAINTQLAVLSQLPNLQPLPIELNQLRTISQLATASVDILRTAQPNTEAQISAIEKELSELQGIERTIAQLRRATDSITSEIEAIDARINDLQEKEKRIHNLDLKRVKTYAALMQKTVEQRLYLQEIIDQFETNQDALLTGLSFAAIFDTPIRSDYINRVVEKVDGRAHSTDSVDLALSPIINNAENQLNNLNLPEDLNDVSAILPLAQQLREWAETARLKKSTTDSEFFNALLSPFFRIGLHIEFNNRPLEALSMGERAVVLLKILLGLDDKPLLIDQPEEHLDNRYIYNELTPVFRSAKTRRQIIITTHNANLVVNTDAEQVIVAEHKDGTLSYRVGALEDLSIRDSIKTILEGGDQAFKKREEKYGYRF